MENKEADNEYIDRVIDGDTHAFRFLVERYQDMIFTIALKIAGKKEDAEDIAQEAFVKCFKSLRSFNRKSRFSTWLYRIAYNHAIDFIKKRKMKSIPLELTGSENKPEETEVVPGENLDRKVLELLLKGAIEKLPAEDRIIVFLYYYNDHSVKEIAEVVGIKENNVKIKLHRIRQKLTNRLQNQKEVISNLIL